MNHLIVNISYVIFIIIITIGLVKIVRNAIKIKAFNKVMKAALLRRSKNNARKTVKEVVLVDQLIS
jgi:hypothetical protein